MARKFYTPLDLTTDNQVINVKDPVAQQDAATKAYVDRMVGSAPLGLVGADGEDGPMGPPGERGPAGVAGSGGGSRRFAYFGG